MGSKSSGDVGIGYWYYLSMHMVLCHGPVDKINRIKAGDYLLWGPVLGAEQQDGANWCWIPDPGYTSSTTTPSYTASFPLGRKPGVSNVLIRAFEDGKPSLAEVSKSETIVVSDTNVIDYAYLQSFIYNTDSQAGDPAVTVQTETTSTQSPGSFPSGNNNWNRYTLQGDEGKLFFSYPCEVGSLKYNGRIVVDRMELFGGKKKEGGFSGDIYVLLGGPDQGSYDPVTKAYTKDGDALTFLRDTIFATVDVADANKVVPSYRGVASVIWHDCCYSANTARPKPWAIETVRVPFRGYEPLFNAHGDDTSTISITGAGTDHANPAHIVLECLLGQTYYKGTWIPIHYGLGYDISNIDLPSFQEAASTLYSEGFGISLLWANTSSVEEFIGEVLRYCDGVVFINPATGKFTMRLIRGGYNYHEKETLNEAVIVQVKDYTRTGTSELVNQVTVQWVDAATNKWQSLTKHNSAIREMQGAVVAVTQQYPGIASRKLADWVAMRDISVLSQPLASVTLVCNRYASKFLLGDVIKWKWKDLGIGTAGYRDNNGTWIDPDDGMALRIVAINYGVLADGKVELKCVEDIYGADLVKFEPMTDSEINDWGSAPVPSAPGVSAKTKGLNPSYMDLVRVTNSANVDIAKLHSDIGFYYPLASRPSSRYLHAKLYSAKNPSSGEPPFKYVKEVDYVPFAQTFAALKPSDISEVRLKNCIQVEEVQGHQINSPERLALIGNEIVQILSIGKNTGTDPEFKDTWVMMVQRGIAHTPPTWQPADTAVWFYSQFAKDDPTQWPILSDVAFKVQNVTAAGETALKDTTTTLVRITDDWYRPYPPGGLQVQYRSLTSGNLETISNPTEVISEMELKFQWAVRNRLTQADKVFSQRDTSVTEPEKGTTYSIRFLNTSGNPLNGSALIENIQETHIDLTPEKLAACGVSQYAIVALYAVRSEVDSFGGVDLYASHYPNCIAVAFTEDGLTTINEMTSFTPSEYIPTTKHPINDVKIINFRVQEGDLVTVGQKTEGRFVGRDPVILWDTNVDDLLEKTTVADIPPNKLVKRYEVVAWIEDDNQASGYLRLGLTNVTSSDLGTSDTIMETVTGELPAYFVTKQEFKYSYAMNTHQGGPRRRFAISVRAVTANGLYSAPAYFVVENPAPIYPSITARALPNGHVMITLGKPEDKDYLQAWYYRSTTPDVPTDTPYGKYSDLTPTDTITSKDPALYFRVRGIDQFGSIGTVLSEVYKVNRVPTLEELSALFFNSDMYKWIISPLEDLFSVAVIRNLISGEVSRLNSVADALTNMKSGVYSGSDTVESASGTLAYMYNIVQSYFSNVHGRIISEEETRANQNSAYAQKITLLDSNVKAANTDLKTQILDWRQTLVNDVSAMARSILQLEATIKGAIGEISAAIHRVDVARVTERNAIAASMSNYSSKLGATTTSIDQLTQSSVGYCTLGSPTNVVGIIGATKETERAVDEWICTHEVGYCTIDGVRHAYSEGGIYATETLCLANGGTWEPGVWHGNLPINTVVTQQKLHVDLVDKVNFIVGSDNSPGLIATSIDQKMQTELTQIVTSNNSLSARWGVKVQTTFNNGTISGTPVITGVFFDDTTSINSSNITETHSPTGSSGSHTATFAILANQFVIAQPNSDGTIPTTPNTVTPFFVDNGNVYIRNALITKLDAQVITGDITRGVNAFVQNNGAVTTDSYVQYGEVILDPPTIESSWTVKADFRAEAQPNGSGDTTLDMALQIFFYYAGQTLTSNDVKATSQDGTFNVYANQTTYPKSISAVTVDRPAFSGPNNSGPGQYAVARLFLKNQVAGKSAKIYNVTCSITGVR